MPAKTIVAGDVGGTNARLATYTVDGEALSQVRREDFPSADFDSLESVLRRYLQSEPSLPAAACLAVAGPVRRGTAHLTNLHWTTSEASLSETGVPQVSLVNDFIAFAHGVLANPTSALALSGTHPGRARRPLADSGVTSRHSPFEDPKRLLFLGPGTGLGMAYCIEGEVYGSEAGHVGLSPTTALEDELVRWLRGRRPEERVTQEALLSGEGLETIDLFLRTQRGTETLARAAETITRTATEGSTDSVRALALFTRLLGSFSGDLALLLSPSAVVLGGGMVPRVRAAYPAFDATYFDALRDKAPMAALVADLPAFMADGDELGLAGAAHLAASVVETR